MNVKRQGENMTEELRNLDKGEIIEQIKRNHLTFMDLNAIKKEITKELRKQIMDNVEHIEGIKFKNGVLIMECD